MAKTIYEKLSFFLPGPGIEPHLENGTSTLVSQVLFRFIQLPLWKRCILIISKRSQFISGESLT